MTVLLFEALTLEGRRKQVKLATILKKREGID